MDHQRYERPQPLRQAMPMAGVVPQSNSRRKKIVKYAGVVLVVALVLFAGYYFYQYRKLTRDPNAAVNSEIKSITARISKFMDLPTDETPTLATVTDPEKLKSQSFFAKVQNGDKVLIYLKARRAVLYRPSTNRVIDMVPLGENVNPNPTPANQPSP